MMKEPFMLKDIKQVDLSSHTVIEASAGTGKTYTIEHLVVELLKQKKVDNINQILVMTYTEKATGELRGRIRQNIAGALGREYSSVLQESLNNFDSAAIYTIHGFCNRVLQQYAFENGGEFFFEVTDDWPVYVKVLHSLMRDTWEDEYGETLPRLLRLAGFGEQDTVTGLSKWERIVIDIAGQFQDRWHSLYPELAGGLADYEKKMDALCTELLNKIGPPGDGGPEMSDLYISYSKLNIRANSKKKRLNKIVVPLARFLAGYREGSAGISELAALMQDLPLKNKNFGELNENWLKEGPNYDRELPALPELIDILDELYCLGMEVPHFLAVKTIPALKQEVIKYKQEQGIISYDDMIRQVYDALETEVSPLQQVLQKNYKYAIVDEFQDTDMQQWTILKRLFLEGSNNRLFIIGDPKQAIYGFRGADVRTYYRAKQEMIRDHGAQFYSLVYNWRSRSGLIELYNLMFADRGWFNDPEIEYIASRCPQEEDVACNDPGEDAASLVAVDLGECTGGTARERMAQYIAAEISSLLQQDDNSVLPGEIAVLLRKWSDALPLERALEKMNIKYAYYKKEGLYQTREAVHIFAVLESVSDPRDLVSLRKALLSDFFGISLDSILLYDDLPVDHPVVQYIDRWSNLAETRQWGKLFNSLLEDSGLLYRLTGRDSGERAIANYRQIFNTLSIEAYRTNCELVHLLKFLQNLITGEQTSDPGLNILKPDSEEKRVQLMTVHASKGLQFHTVFIAAGFTNSDKSSYRTYHVNGKKVFDLVKRDAFQDLYEQELNGDDDRLYYVAFTRARERLYVPTFKGGGGAKTGYAGNKFVKAVERCLKSRYVQVVDHSAGIGTGPLQRQPGQTGRFIVPEPRFNEQKTVFLDRNPVINSFSKIKSSSHAGDRPQVSFGELYEDLLQDEQYEIPDIYLSADNGEEIVLPGGSITGTMMHELFENIDFSSVREKNSLADMNDDPGIRKLIEMRVDRYLHPETPQQRASYRKEISVIIWNTLKTELGNGFALCDITEKVHEMEFYYPYPDAGNTKEYLHGFIDLVFEHDEKLYILDWKSNYIARGYGPEEVRQNIMESQYDLQYAIYAQALFKWQRSINAVFSYEKQFGGIYYIYLRGMDVNNPGRGVYFYRPENENDFKIQWK